MRRHRLIFRGPPMLHMLSDAVCLRCDKRMTVPLLEKSPFGCWRIGRYKRDPETGHKR